MDFSITIATKWFIFNMIACLIQFLIQDEERIRGRIPVKHSIIPGTRQKFLYWQDFSTQTWGDIIGLGMMWVGFGHLQGYIDRISWILLGAVAVVSSLAFWSMCTRPMHKPDWGYPETMKVSIGGYAHLVYFGASVGMVAGSIPFIITNYSHWVAPLSISIIGANIWTIAAMRDYKMGRFDPIKRI